MSFGNMRRSAQQNSNDLNQMAKGCAWFFVAVNVGIIFYVVWTAL